MRPPARAVIDNLIWSADGGVWAVWRAFPFPFAHAPDSARLGVHGRLRALIMGLPPDAALFSVCEAVEPAEVVEAMIADVDLEACPAWRQAAAAALTDLEETGAHRRRYWLAAALPETRRTGVRGLLGSAAQAVGTGFGLAPLPVLPEEVEARVRQAEAVRSRFTGVELAPATPGELRWLYARSLRRGLAEPFHDETWEPRPGPNGRRGAPRPSLLPLTEGVFFEGGARDDEHRPRHRRYLRVDTLAGTSYQALLALATMPHEFTFPGTGEWFTHVEAMPFPVDWCVRLHSVDNAEAQAKARRQHRQLVGQLDEYDGEVTGVPSSLASALAAVDDERDALAANPAERECQATVVFALGAERLDDLEARAAALGALLEPADYGLARPTGGQLGLFRSMLPGTRPAAVCRDYTQFLLARDLAGGAPLCSSEVGDPGGMLLGASLDAGVFVPVLMDPAYGPAVDRSASAGIVGALGSGKSYLAKLLAWATVARGGQVVTLDRTASGEYVAFAAAVPGRAQVVRLAEDSPVCLDPLRVFSGDDRRQVTLGFCSLLAGANPRSVEGAALAEAVEAAAARSDARLADVIDELGRIADHPDHPDPEARAAARKLRHFARLGAGHLAFGDAAPVSLDADFIVFHAPGLALPEREQAGGDLLPEQVLGQALLYLVAAVARSVVFADPRRFAAALFDEAWALTATPQGQALLLTGIRDGRKHNAAVWVASQSPRDFGSPELVDLLGNRFVFRQARGATVEAQRFLGLDPDDATADLLEHQLGRGQCLWRDVRDRVGLVQVLEAPLSELQAAFDTNPHRAAATVVAVAAAPPAEPPGPPPDAPPGDPAHSPRSTRRRVLAALA